MCYLGAMNSLPNHQTFRPEISSHIGFRRVENRMMAALGASPGDAPAFESASLRLYVIVTGHRVAAGNNFMRMLERLKELDPNYANTRIVFWFDN